MSQEHHPIPIATGPTAASGPASDGAGDPGPSWSTPASQTPPIDIHEGPDGLILEADLPGTTESCLVIQLEQNVLSLRAVADPDTLPQGRLIHQEYCPGDYGRSFILSDEVDRSRITAEINNGVLRLELPRSERARTRRIEVKSP